MKRLSRFMCLLILALVLVPGFAFAQSWNAGWGQWDDVEITGGSIDGTPVGETTPEAGAFTTGNFTGDTDHNGNYALQLQNIPDLAAKGAGYWFDGVDDRINILPTQTLAATSNYSFIVEARPDTLNDFVLFGGNAANGSGAIFDGSNTFTYQQNGSKRTVATDIEINRNYIFAFVNVATAAVFYVNGKSQGTLALSSVFDFDFRFIGSGWDIAYYFMQGQIGKFLLFNLALDNDDAIDKAIINGGDVPYMYRGASQTELMPNQVDRDFSGASAWADVDLNAYNETTDLTITANAADQYCTLLVASAPTEIGLEYEMTFDIANIVSTWTIKSFDGTQTLGIVSANGTGQTIRWTAETTGGYRIVAVADDSSADFDNFKLKHIGCVLLLTQKGIGHNQWLPDYGDIKGAVSGVIPIGLSPNHIEKYIDLAVTGNSSYILPLGYKIVSVIAKETAGNALTGGLDMGISANGVEIISGMAVGANATVLCTLVEAGTIGATFTTADDVIYFSDGDDNTNWDGAEIELYVQMQRITMN